MVVKSYLSILFFFCGISFGLSQISDESTKLLVSYEDGSYYIGELVSETRLDLKMVLATRDTITLDKAWITSMLRTDRNIQLYDNGKYHYSRGILYGFHFGGGGDEGGTSTIEIIAAYRPNQNWALGLGFGSSVNSTFQFGTSIDASAIPFFAYGRFYPLNKLKSRPFISTKIGWAFPDQNNFEGDHEGGFLFHPEIGFNFASRKRVRWLISIGQQIQNIRGEGTNFDPFGNSIRTNFNVWFNRTVFKFGVEWN